MYDFARNGAVLKYMCGGKYMNEGGRANGDPIPEPGTYAYAKMRAMEQTGSNLDDLIKYVRKYPDNPEAKRVQSFINAMYSDKPIPRDLPSKMGFSDIPGAQTLWYNNDPALEEEEMDYYDEPIKEEKPRGFSFDPSLFNQEANGSMRKMVPKMDNGGRTDDNPPAEPGTYAWAKWRAQKQTGSDLDDLISYVRANPDSKETPRVQSFINAMYSDKAIPEDLPSQMGYNRSSDKSLWYTNDPTLDEGNPGFDPTIEWYNDGGKTSDDPEPSASDYRGRAARLRRKKLKKAMQASRKEAKRIARSRARTGDDLVGTAAAQIGDTEAGAELERGLKGRGIALHDYYTPRQRARRERQLLDMAKELGLPEESFAMTDRGFRFTDRLPGGEKTWEKALPLPENATDEEIMARLAKINEFERAYSDYVDPTTNVNALNLPEINLPQFERGKRERDGGGFSINIGGNRGPRNYRPMRFKTHRQPIGKKIKAGLGRVGDWFKWKCGPKGIPCSAFAEAAKNA